MVNGTRIIGELRSITVGIVQFKANGSAVLNIRRHNIRTLSATVHDFKVETLNGEMYFGKILPSAQSGYIHMMGQDVKITEIFTLYYFRSGIFRQVQGSFSAGYSFTKNSGTGRLNTDAALRMQERRYEVRPTISSITSFNKDDSVSREREDVNIQVLYDLTPFIFPAITVAYERNLQLGLIRRFSQSVGLGTKVLLSPHLHARVVTGIVMNQERYIDGRRSGNIAEVPVAFTFNAFKYTAPAVSLATTQTLYFGIRQHGRTRLEGETRLAWEIITDFNVNIAVYNSYDSRPSVSANGTSDLSMVFGIGYTF